MSLQTIYNKYKDDIKIIAEVLAFILIILSFSLINNLAILYVCLSIAIISWSIKLYFKIQYRNGKADYILIPTQNDQYYKQTSIILGLILVLLSIVGFVWTNKLNQYSVIGIPFGMLVFFNGIFDLPKCKIIFNNNELDISGLKKLTDKRQIKMIEIFEEKIILTNIYDEVQRIDNLEINLSSSKVIEKYILENTNNIEIKIINNVC